ncbi:MAG TPA: DUF6712 family protein, partial [Chitinophagaceae bacterium]|nr:DUF6712 family protein [Chitinophagaceae bacterium]
MLFKTTAEIKAYAQFTGDINFASIKPTLRFVETFHLIAILGKELYRSLETAYTTGETSMSENQKALLEQCRLMVAPYLVYYYAPKADVQLSDGGMTKNKEAAYQYQGAAFREAALREAEMCEELLLEFLEENKADYAEWTNSNVFKEYRSLFIKTGGEFAELFSSSSPYRNYRAIRTKMPDVEEQMIRMAIGDTLFDGLKTKDAGAQNFTDQEKALLFKLKKAIAYQSVALSVPLLNVRIDAAGISVVAKTASGSSDEKNSRTGAADEALRDLVSTCTDGAKAWLKSAKEYLETNASHFTWTKPAAEKFCSIN